AITSVSVHHRLAHAELRACVFSTGDCAVVGLCEVDSHGSGDRGIHSEDEIRNQVIFLCQSAESAIGFGRRLQRLQIAGLRNMGSCSIPTAPTKTALLTSS